MVMSATVKRKRRFKLTTWGDPKKPFHLTPQQVYELLLKQELPK